MFTTVAGKHGFLHMFATMTESKYKKNSFLENVLLFKNINC